MTDPRKAALRALAAKHNASIWYVVSTEMLALTTNLNANATKASTMRRWTTEAAAIEAEAIAVELAELYASPAVKWSVVRRDNAVTVTIEKAP